MKQFLLGASYILYGFRNLFHPAAKKFVLIPIVINISIFVLAFWWSYHVGSTRLESMLAPVDFSDWLNWLETIVNWILGGIKWLLAIIWFFLFAFLFSIFGSAMANLIASPFNGLLTESIDKKVNQFEAKPMSTTQLVMHSLWREVRKLLYYLPRLCLVGLACLILYFIPVVNIIATGILYCFGAWMLAFQYLDFPADNRQVSVGTLKKSIKQQRMLSYGFGFAIFALTLTPILNFVVLPVATIGATKLWADQYATNTNEASKA